MKYKINIRYIDVNTKEYEEELDLRNEVLRKPIGLNIYDEKLTEENDYHIGLFSENKLVAVLVLTPIKTE